MLAGAPAPFTTFVGRRRELQTLRRLLASSRFLTLVGPGGCGKTRLAIELCRRDRISKVAWVDLAPLGRVEDVQPDVSRSLGLALPDRIAKGVRDQPTEGRTLLVLDNCEHLLEPSAEVAIRVLTANAGARVLATSREPLDVEGELIWRVPSLSVPDPQHANDPMQSSRTDAVRLFVERARLAQPGFALDRVTCPHVVAICRAVDGIPLALELAAARLRHASVAELAGRLDDLLAVLVGTRRGGDPRHRTLGAALDWSHALLDEREQAVFRRLAVFAGGFRIDAAESVCVDDDIRPSEVLGHVASLVDKSLVTPQSQNDRYRLLEPIREYALDHLRASREEELVSERCSRHLVELVMSALPDPMGMAKGSSLRRVTDEFTNTTAILPWLISQRPGDAVRVLARFAQNHLGLIPIHVSVVVEWLRLALSAHTSRDATRVEGLLGQVQLLAQFSQDRRQARALADEAVEISRELNDEALEARALSRSAFLAAWDDPPRALREYDSAVPALRRVHLGALALALSGRAVLRQCAGDPIGAEEDIAEALTAWDRHSGPSSILRVNTLQAGADVAFRAGNADLAERRVREAIETLRRSDQSSPTGALLVGSVEFLAHLAALKGDDERALVLSGFADRLRDDTGVWPRPWFSLTDRGWLSDVEARSGRHARSLRTDGRRLSLGQGAAYALGGLGPGTLSSRELSVTGLVAEGLTDKEIGARLGISERTVETHVQRIRVKLGLQSRAQIGGWAAEHALTVR